MENITLNNGEVKATLNTRVGLESLIVKGEERIFQNENRIWPNIKRKPNSPSIHSDPVLFPITGPLKKAKYVFGKEYMVEGGYLYNGKFYLENDPVYLFNGESYSMPQHGFVRDSAMELVDFTSYECTFLKKSNSETLKQYPFHFEYYLTYKLTEDGLSKKQTVVNMGPDEMYFSLGDHTALALEGGIDSHTIMFDEDVRFNSEEPISFSFAKNQEIPLGHFIRDRKTLVAENSSVNNIKFFREGIEKISYDVSAPVLLLWTADREKFICAEPWIGAPRALNSINESLKNGTLIKLSPEDDGFVKERKIVFR
jgi:Galactose mutarotase and related enzymes